GEGIIREKAERLDIPKLLKNKRIPVIPSLCQDCINVLCKWQIHPDSIVVTRYSALAITRYKGYSNVTLTVRIPGEMKAKIYDKDIPRTLEDTISLVSQYSPVAAYTVAHAIVNEKKKNNKERIRWIIPICTDHAKSIVNNVRRLLKSEDSKKLHPKIQSLLKRLMIGFLLNNIIYKTYTRKPVNPYAYALLLDTDGSIYLNIYDEKSLTQKVAKPIVVTINYSSTKKAFADIKLHLFENMDEHLEVVINNALLKEMPPSRLYTSIKRNEIGVKYLYRIATSTDRIAELFKYIEKGKVVVPVIYDNAIVGMKYVVTTNKHVRILGYWSNDKAQAYKLKVLDEPIYLYIPAL
ncbi:MAG: hypothetical protein GXO26_07725, partial [Crenarchaeota archaeon]|nr:hypothetical protein [Thermoproteota archaeon]